MAVAAIALALRRVRQAAGQAGQLPEHRRHRPPYAKDFSLTDHTGKPRTLADFKGKVVVVFFGYTQCPDVCPTTMAEMAGVMKKLGPQADQVQVLFITLDPERDTQELLAAYVPAFDKRFVGLRGTPEQTAPWPRNSRCSTQGAGQGAGQLHHRPHGRQLCVRQGGQAAPVHPPRPGAGRRSCTTFVSCCPDRHCQHAWHAHGPARKKLYPHRRRHPAGDRLPVSCCGPSWPRSCSPPPSSSRPGRCTCACCAPEGRRTLAALTMTLSPDPAGHHPAGAGRLEPGRQHRHRLRAAQGQHRHGDAAAAGWIRDIPLVGEQIDTYLRKLLASREQMLELAQRMLEPARHWLLAGGMVLGSGVVQMSLAAFVSFFFYRDGKPADRVIGPRCKRDGRGGGSVTDTVSQTVRGVMYGLLGTALAQAWWRRSASLIAGVPAVALLSVLVFVFSLIPVGPPADLGRRDHLAVQPGQHRLGHLHAGVGLLRDQRRRQRGAADADQPRQQPAVHPDAAGGVLGGVFIAFGFIGPVHRADLEDAGGGDLMQPTRRATFDQQDARALVRARRLLDHHVE
jgi:hypothetical protein